MRDNACHMECMPKKLDWIAKRDMFAVCINVIDQNVVWPAQRPALQVHKRPECVEGLQVDAPESLKCAGG